jgi:serine/threonine-protein kinase
MNIRIKHASFRSNGEQTGIRPPVFARKRAKICCPKREAAKGSGPHLTKETQALLQYRLGASALLLLIGFGVFLVQHVVGVYSNEPFDPFLFGFHVLVVLVLSFSMLLLSRHRPIPTRKLRIAELVVFGLPIAFFLVLQHRTTLFDVGRGFMSPPLATWLLLIFTYGMLIPNTWRRAALVIGATATAPVLLVVGMMAWYPNVAAVTRLADFTQYLLVMGVATVGAVFGTHLINTLRREALEAKQLGQYRLIELLGAGGMGEVYLAEHRMLKRPCAIKLIPPDRSGDPRVLARFEREVRMTAQLSHWNTVEIFDYGRTEDGTFFYVMEYLPGLSLEDLLERHGPLAPERVVHLLRQTCQGLREAHGVGLIHRDIKPGNIFVAQRGGLYDVAKLLDFGLVKPICETPSVRLTQDGVISGTPLFMSPEQARGRDDLDARSDIYSLGAVAYAMMTGHAPFEGSNPLEVMIAVAHEEVAPPSRLHAGVPVDLERVILRCLAKRPEDRYPNTESLEHALAECAAADQWTQSDAARWWKENDRTSAATLESRAALETRNWCTPDASASGAASASTSKWLSSQMGVKNRAPIATINRVND